MKKISIFLVVVIALIHFYIMAFEMFLWEQRGPMVFSSFPSSIFAQTKQIAANQGLYNGFLAVGLVWSVFIRDPIWSRKVALCFLSFVLVAGVFGMFTVEQKILFVQAIPAALAILSILFL